MSIIPTDPIPSRKLSKGYLSTDHTYALEDSKSGVVIEVKYFIDQRATKGTELDPPTDWEITIRHMFVGGSGCIMHALTDYGFDLSALEEEIIRKELNNTEE